MVSLGNIKYQTKGSVEPTLSVDQIPNLECKVVVVTGGNSGIFLTRPHVTNSTTHQSRQGVGRDICKHLLLKNAKVYLADESQDHATVIIAEMAIETDGKYAQFLHLDLADLDAVNQSAETILK